MKYRIVQKGDKFYPQTKDFIFWCPVLQRNVEDMIIECWSYKEAFDILKEIKRVKELPKEKVIIHEIYL